MTGLDVLIVILAIPLYMLTYDGVCKLKGYDGYEPGKGCVTQVKREGE